MKNTPAILKNSILHYYFTGKNDDEMRAYIKGILLTNHIDDYDLNILKSYIKSHFPEYLDIIDKFQLLK